MEEILEKELQNKDNQMKRKFEEKEGEMRKKFKDKVEELRDESKDVLQGKLMEREDELRREFGKERKVLLRKLEEKEELRMKVEQKEEDLKKNVATLAVQELDLRKKLEVTEEELNYERKVLKKLEETAEETMATLRSEIMTLQVEKYLSESKMKKQTQFCQQLKDKLECPICLEVPHHGPVPVCPNGHVVCIPCKTELCPTCRQPMGSGKSLLANLVLEHVEQKCKFVGCDEELILAKLDQHEAVCQHRTVTCPYPNCGEKVSLSKLVDHLRASKDCCAESGDPLRAHKKKWNRTNYLIKEKTVKNLSWKIHIYSISGQIFSVFPLVADEHYYFVIIMFGSEAECSKFKFEMIVHEHGVDPLESEDSFRFCGSPLSIDAEKEDLNVYGVSERLMKKMLQKNVSFSFKVEKKDSSDDEF